MLSLMIVVGLIFIIPIVLERLRWNFLPVVVVEITAGIILGKSGVGFIQPNEWLTILSSLGFIFLMFLSGLEIDFESFQAKKKTAAKLSPISIASLTFLLILVISVIFGYSFQVFGFVGDGIFMTLIISTISLSVVVPVLKDKGIINTPYGQSILVTAVISDFATMILLSVYVAFQSANAMKPLLLLILFVVMFFFYRMGIRFKKGKVIERISRESVQLGTRGVFALILFFVVLSEQVGAESILGAFLAGVIISLLSPKKEFVHQLTSFGFGFLIPIFFFMVGANLELRGLLNDLPALTMIPFILISFFASKFLPVLLWKRWFSWSQTLGAGVLLPSTLSLVIAGTEIGLELKIITPTLQAALILSAVISAIFSPILFQKIAPEDQKELVRRKVSLVGANTVNLALAKQLYQDGYDVRMFTSDQTLLTQGRSYDFETISLKQMNPEELANYQATDSDYFVAFTTDDELNVQLANWAKQDGVENVICRMDTEEKAKDLVEGVQTFSPFLSSRILLQALIEYPALFKFLHMEQNMQEVHIENENLHNRLIKELSFLGDALVIRIFRENNMIIPHGDTQIKWGDILLISADAERISMIRQECS